MNIKMDGALYLFIYQTLESLKSNKCDISSMSLVSICGLEFREIT